MASKAEQYAKMTDSDRPSSKSVTYHVKTSTYLVN